MPPCRLSTVVVLLAISPWGSVQPANADNRQKVIDFIYDKVLDLLEKPKLGDLCDEFAKLITFGATVEDIAKKAQNIVLPRLKGDTYMKAFKVLGQLDKCTRPKGGLIKATELVNALVADIFGPLVKTCATVMNAPKGPWDSEKFYDCAVKNFRHEIVQEFTCAIKTTVGAEVYQACLKPVSSLLLAARLYGDKC